MAAATTSIIATGADRNLSPEEVLEALTSLLGSNYLKDDSASPLQKSSPHEWSLIPWEPASSSSSDDDEEDEGPVFSSFPSLSLERRAQTSAELDSSGLAASSSHQHRQAIEARVASLLSRPILVSSGNSNDSSSSSNDDDDELLAEEGDDDCEFMAAAAANVPTMMLHNFFNSFSTLMNSRLRAYATFLARHGLALFSESSNDELAEEGIVGVEQKLETMLEIGRLMSTTAIVTSFHAKKNEAQTKPMNDNDDGTLQVTMPIEMEAAIDITLPSPSEGQNEVVTVVFRTSGSVTGIFSIASETSLLRVVQVDLDMSKLLPSMIDKASETISRIVEMTNSLYSWALPRFDDAQDMMQPMKIPLSPIASPVRVDDHRPANERKRATLVEEEDVAVVSPGLNPFLVQPGSSLMPDLNLLDDGNNDGSFLSRESCESLVDYVFNDTNETVLSPPNKKAKLVLFGTASALPTVF